MKHGREHMKIEVDLDELKKFLKEYSTLLKQEGEIVSTAGECMGKLAENAQQQLDCIDAFFKILGLHSDG